MSFTAAVITISDKGYRGERTDTSGPALARLLTENGYMLAHTELLPDNRGAIEQALVRCADGLHIGLVVTTGGTGLSPRDVTPEATLSVCEREVRGIPELMRQKSCERTPMGCLSRAVCGIRGRTLMLNLPGSERAAVECLSFVLHPLSHGLEVLCGVSADCANKNGVVEAVCLSERKGTRKSAVASAILVENYGIEGDAHADGGHRQVSLLGVESVDKLRERVKIPIDAGAFAENILTRGIVLYELPTGAKLKIGGCLLEITQIGKECHSDCEIRRRAGDCVMPREGVFARVLRGGEIKRGAPISVL